MESELKWTKINIERKLARTDLLFICLGYAFVRLVLCYLVAASSAGRLLFDRNFSMSSPCDP
jgi:hypothetical protein